MFNVRLAVSVSLLMVLPLAGCRKQTTRLNEATQDYQVISEGEASGVTSTILAPGETPPPVTNTNIDTTTNFSVVQEGIPPVTGTDTTLGSSLPPVAAVNIPGQPTTTTTLSPRPAQPSYPYPTARRQPPPTETQAPPAAPPPAAEEPPTQTDTAREPEIKPDTKKEEPPPEPPTETDTAPEPTQTDTSPY